MKFIVDAQLPKPLAYFLKDRGFDTIHTKDLPEGNLTQDSVIIDLSVIQNRIVISKDSDFYEHYILRGTPSKLMMITTGNIRNKDLLQLFEENFEQILALIAQHNVIEMNNESIIVHY